MIDLPVSDLLSLVWFVIVWVGYTVYADRHARRTQSLRAVMHAYREQWMREMLLRDNRVVDVNILRNLLQGVAFFASATLLVLAGLLTILGSTDRAIAIVRALPYAATTTLLQWELKLIVMCIIFVYAFFKFTWALRQFNYCSTLIGAAPKGPDDTFARRAAEMATHASKDFNQGLRGILLQSRGTRLVRQPMAVHGRDNRGGGCSLSARVSFKRIECVECCGKRRALKTLAALERFSRPPGMGLCTTHSTMMLLLQK